LVYTYTMTTSEKFDYWKDIAQYDLKIAQAMYKTGRWRYLNGY